MEKKKCQDVKDVKDVKEVKVTEMGLAPSFRREGREGPTRARVFPSHLQPRDAHPQIPLSSLHTTRTA